MSTNRESRLKKPEIGVPQIGVLQIGVPQGRPNTAHLARTFVSDATLGGASH